MTAILLIVLIALIYFGMLGSSSAFMCMFFTAGDMFHGGIFLFLTLLLLLALFIVVLAFVLNLNEK